MRKANVFESGRGPVCGHPLDPNLNGLYWSWQSGCVFLALEGLWKGSAEATASGYFLSAWAGTPTGPRSCLEASLEVPARCSLRRWCASDLISRRSCGDPSPFHREGGHLDSFPTRGYRGGGVGGQPAGSLHLARRGAKSSRCRKNGFFDPGPPGAGEPGLARWEARFLRPRNSPTLPPRLTGAAIELGRRLFRDGALSGWRDLLRELPSAGRPRLRGSSALQPGGRRANRCSPRRAAFQFSLEAGVLLGRTCSLIARAGLWLPIPDPREMDETLENVVGELDKGGYGPAFAAAFATGEITPERIGLALESFLLTLTSRDSKFDRAMRGETELTAQEERGFTLFMTERDPAFGRPRRRTVSTATEARFLRDHRFRNNGLAVAETDLGRYRVTGAALDRGTFATPSLRNIASTAPAHARREIWDARGSARSLQRGSATHGHARSEPREAPGRRPAFHSGRRSGT